MKLHNQSLKYLSVALLGIISVWAVVFYFSLMDEVYDSLDDGLDNSRMLIIQHARQDSTVLTRNELRESNYLITKLTEGQALRQTDRYYDTLMYMQNEDDLEPVRVLTTAFDMNGRYYKLTVMTSMVEEDDLVEGFLWGLGGLYLLVLLAVFWINNKLLDRLWQPFYSVLSQMKTYRPGTAPLAASVQTRIAEFRELKAAADELFEHTHRAFIAQKQFIENAAHELQTPLAISQNRLEMLLEKQQLSEEQAVEVAKISETLQQLIRFNRSLLLLSRIENRQYLESAPIPINEVVEEVVDNFKDFAAHKKVGFDIKMENPLTAQLNPDLARILFTNLIKNALVHNLKGGKVYITLAETEVRICNTGSPNPLDGEKIFHRFFKETPTTGDTGLGLAIGKAIADVYALRLSYHFDGQHCFTVGFPTATKPQKGPR